jgi:N-acetylmuramoyl-L-alanine amidase
MSALRSLTLALCCLCSMNAYAFDQSAKLRVLIDPGHGGSDSGAVRGNLRESHIALKVSKILEDMLKADERFAVSMTRESDVKIPLAKRTQIAKDVQADVLLSIHLNTSADPRAHGKEFYFQNQLPVEEDMLFLANRENSEDEGEAEAAKRAGEKLSSANDIKFILDDLGRNHRIQSSGALSKVLLENWLKVGGSKKVGSRSIRQAPFHMVSNVNIPSVLVELGFLTHASEGPRLAQEDYQKTLAKSLYEGLVKFKETVDKEEGGNLKSAESP